QDGTKDTTAVPHVEHTYNPTSVTSGKTKVTLKSPGCKDQELEVTVTHRCHDCPAGQHLDATGNCVPDTTPVMVPATSGTLGPADTTMPSCSIWCILAGIFFIAIPISAQISTAAHCVGGPFQGIVQAVQAALIAAT